MTSQVIPTSFKVPLRYARRFVLQRKGEQMEIIFKRGRMVMRQWGAFDCNGRDDEALDWIQESIESVRMELCP